MTVVLMASQRRRRHLVQALRSLVTLTRLEPGCLTCAVCSDLESTLRYMEEWATELDLERRMRSDSFASLLAIIGGAEEPPKVRFDFYTLSRGLDYVREIRHQ